MKNRKKIKQVIQLGNPIVEGSTVVVQETDQYGIQVAEANGQILAPMNGEATIKEFFARLMKDPNGTRYYVADKGLLIVLYPNGKTEKRKFPEEYTEMFVERFGKFPEEKATPNENKDVITEAETQLAAADNKSSNSLMLRRLFIIAVIVFVIYQSSK